MQTQLKNYSSTIFVGWQDKNRVSVHQKFRKQLFVDVLQWDLTHCDGLEFDEFDTHRAVYCLLYRDGEPIGGWRAIRSTEDYLSRKVFPELAPLRTYPSSPDIWEISRLGVLPHLSEPVSALLVYALMVHFAVTRNASSLVGVVDVTHARMMSISGLNLRSLGATMNVGNDLTGKPIMAFLAEMLLANQGGERFERILNLIDNLEIRDDAFLLGPETISA